MSHLTKQCCIEHYRLLTICIIILFVTTSLTPVLATAPILQDLLSLVKDSDVVALIQIDDPECKTEFNDRKCEDRHNQSSRKSPNIDLNALQAAVHFKFIKVFREPSWCKTALNSPQVLATYFKSDYHDQKQYIVFLQASSDNNQWWDIADKWMFMPVDQEQILDARKKCHDLFPHSIFGEWADDTFASALSGNVSLSEFGDRLKIVGSSIPEANKHKLDSTEKYLKLTATQARLNKIMNKWRWRGNSDPTLSIEQFTEVINIAPAKEPFAPARLDLSFPWQYK